jgi:hypothetical protein
MKEITIQIEGKDFTINLEKAKSLGLLKEDRSIKEFFVGDVFSLGFEPILIVQNSYPDTSKEQRYNIAGSDGLFLYCDIGIKGASKEEMLMYLNKERSGCGLKFVKNINSEIETLLRNTLKK